MLKRGEGREGEKGVHVMFTKTEPRKMETKQTAEKGGKKVAYVS